MDRRFGVGMTVRYVDIDGNALPGIIAAIVEGETEATPTMYTIRVFSSKKDYYINTFNAGDRNCFEPA